VVSGQRYTISDVAGHTPGVSVTLSLCDRDSQGPVAPVPVTGLIGGSVLTGCGLTDPDPSVTLPGDDHRSCRTRRIAHVVQRLSAQFATLDGDLVQRVLGDTDRRFALADSVTGV